MLQHAARTRLSLLQANCPPARPGLQLLFRQWGLGSRGCISRLPYSPFSPPTFSPNALVIRHLRHVTGGVGAEPQHWL